MKKLLFVLLICTLLLSSYACAKEFPDVASTHWAHQYISELSDKGVINGYEDGSYRPSGTVTRAEFLKLVTSCLDKKDFDEYSKDFVEMSKNMNLPWHMLYYEVGNNSGICYPEYYQKDKSEPASREEMVKILFSYCYKQNLLNDVLIKKEPVETKSYQEIAYDLKYIKNKDMSEEEFLEKYEKLTEKQMEKIEEEYNNSIEYLDSPIFEEVVKFNDLEELDTNEKVIIEYVVKLGLLKGYEDDTFRLSNNLTRAEASTVIYRLLNLKRGEKNA